MLLALDIGNSQTSYGVFDSGRLIHHWRSETRVSRSSHEYAALLWPWLEHVGLKTKDFTDIVLCSVVPPVEQAFEEFSKEFFKLQPYKIHSGISLGFPVSVDVPSEVGADRLANAAYAMKLLKLPAIVVDLGTATTFDVVTANGGFEGGAIFPGLRMGVEALGGKTAKLPMVELEFPKRVIGKNTIECIRAGILFGYCSLLDGMLERTQAELGAPATIALTGGLAYLLHPHLKRASELLPNLTLEGIEILYRQMPKLPAALNAPTSAGVSARLKI